MTQMGVTHQADLEQFNIETLEMNINKIMFNIVVPNSREVTASEYLDRKSELVKMAMNSYGRMVGFVENLIKRMIEVLQRGGYFPLEFDAAMFDGFGAKIKMNTILAQGADIERVQKQLQSIGMLNQFDPTGQTTQRFVKTDSVIPKLLMHMGMSAEDIRTAEEIAEFDRHMAEAAEQQHQRAIQEQVAVSNAVEAGKARAKGMQNAA
jgi:hypothetical protein